MAVQWEPAPSRKRGVLLCFLGALVCCLSVVFWVVKGSTGAGGASLPAAAVESALRYRQAHAPSSNAQLLYPDAIRHVPLEQRPMHWRQKQMVDKLFNQPDYPLNTNR